MKKYGVMIVGTGWVSGELTPPAHHLVDQTLRHARETLAALLQTC